jgi:hypothetical protein
MIVDLVPLYVCLVVSCTPWLLCLLSCRRRIHLAAMVLRLTLYSATCFVVMGLYGPLVPAYLPDHQPRGVMVFGIGLSRTGTTSMAVALREFGLKSHHATGRLVRLNGTANAFWAQAFDAQTDIQVSLVYKELFDMFPTAKFVLTSRDPKAWAKASLAFFGDHAWLWKLNQPVEHVGMISADNLFKRMYGNEYAQYDVEAWERVYKTYEADVIEFFTKKHNAAHRLYKFDVTKDGYDELARVIGTSNVPKHLQHQRLPRVYVFAFTFFTQTWWQLVDLADLCFGLR